MKVAYSIQQFDFILSFIIEIAYTYALISVYAIRA